MSLLTAGHPTMTMALIAVVLAMTAEASLLITPFGNDNEQQRSLESYPSPNEGQMEVLPGYRYQKRAWLAPDLLKRRLAADDDRIQDNGYYWDQCQFSPLTCLYRKRKRQTPGAPAGGFLANAHRLRSVMRAMAEAHRRRLSFHQMGGMPLWG